MEESKNSNSGEAFEVVTQNVQDFEELDEDKLFAENSEATQNNNNPTFEYEDALKHVSGLHRKSKIALDKISKKK